MHAAMPVPLTMNAKRRPSLSIVKNETKQDRSFQVSVPPDRMRDVWASRSRPCWKMTVEYTDMRFPPAIC